MRLPNYHPDWNPIEKIWDIVKTRIAAKDVTFKQQDVQQLAEQNFAAVAMEEWAAVCRHVKGVEAEYMSRKHEMDTIVERIIISADDDDNDDTSESTVSCDDSDDVQADGPVVSDSEWSEVKLVVNWSELVKWRGAAVAQWLMRCATNRKVAGSILDGVIGLFHWHNPSDRTNRNEYQENFLGVNAPGA